MERAAALSSILLVLSACTAGRLGILDGDVSGFDAAVRDAGPPRDAAMRDGSLRDAGRDAAMAGDGGVGDAGDPDASGPLAISETDCGDGRDEDGDGATDCEDLECNREPCASGGRVCLLGSCGGCRGEPSETACGDAADEDCDGLRDCLDPDCDGQVCGPAVSCSASACPCASGFTELLCGDTTDDDCDGMVDCMDPDCSGRTCGPFGLVCNTGACSCIGLIEFCQGGDDNCTGSPDEGCPEGVLLSNPTAGGAFGLNTGTVFSDPCPAGMILAGIAGLSGPQVQQIQPLCAPILLEVDESTRPDFTYTFRRGAVVRGMLHGGTTGTAFEDLCPPDQVVIGVRGDTDIALNAFGLTCASVSVTRNVFTWVLTISATVTTPVRGTVAGLGSFVQNCPADAVVTDLNGRASATRVERIGYGCQRLSLDPI